MSIKKILIVDDEQPIYSYLEKKFTKFGYTTFIASDGEEALRMALENLPDIMLLDVKLPKMSGIEVCRKIKSNDLTRKIPVIMFSARAQSSEIKEGLEAGADKYLCKPVSFSEILKEIRTYD